MPRYLKALQIRAERAALNPVKDQERARQLAPCTQALRELRAGTAGPCLGGRNSPQLAKGSDPAANDIEEFRWMIEEFKVSFFAQELGTAVSVSPKRLDEVLRRLGRNLCWPTAP